MAVMYSKLGGCLGETTKLGPLSRTDLWTGVKGLLERLMTKGHNLARNIKESIYIRVNNPTLNNNIGKFNLSHIWDRVLHNTKGLTHNNQSNNNNNQLNNPH